MTFRIAECNRCHKQSAPLGGMRDWMTITVYVHDEYGVPQRSRNTITHLCDTCRWDYYKFEKGEAVSTPET